MLISRALQEWACLLPQDLPFESATRLLGWMTGEDQVLCSSELRRLVRAHLTERRVAAECGAVLAGQAGEAPRGDRRRGLVRRRCGAERGEPEVRNARNDDLCAVFTHRDDPFRFVSSWVRW